MRKNQKKDQTATFKAVTIEEALEAIKRPDTVISMSARNLKEMLDMEDKNERAKVQSLLAAFENLIQGYEASREATFGTNPLMEKAKEAITAYKRSIERQ